MQIVLCRRVPLRENQPKSGLRPAGKLVAVLSGWVLEEVVMKQVGLALAMLLAVVSMGEAQYEAPHLETGAQLRLAPEVDTDLETRANMSLRAPATTFAISAGLAAGLGLTTSMLAISHCEGDCDSMFRGTVVAFAGTLAAASLALSSLIWWITRGSQRHRARAALRGLSVFGGGLRF